MNAGKLRLEPRDGDYYLRFLKLQGPNRESALRRSPVTHTHADQLTRAESSVP